MFKGIDVSYHQGEINWLKVKADEIKFAMLRAGYGKNNIDKQFKRNIQQCNYLNIPVGVYWFSYALNEQMAREEAKYCLNIIKDYKVEYPVAFDLEYDTIRYAKEKGINIDKDLASKMVKAFCSEVENQGYYAINYANKDYLNNMFTPDLLVKYDLWYAYWGKEKDMSCGIWQYTSSGKVEGIKGNVDMNYAYKDYLTIIKNIGLNGFTKKEDGKIPTHWAEKHYSSLISKGIDIQEKRFNDSMTRGEVFSLLDEIIKE